MKLYNCYDETLQHGNQVISALFEDNHRQLWVGTDDGVYIQELATGKFSFFVPAQRAESKSDTTGLKIFWQIIQEISG